MAFFLALKFIDNSMEQMFEERKEEKDANNRKEEMTISGLCPRTTIMAGKCRPGVPRSTVGQR